MRFFGFCTLFFVIFGNIFVAAECTCVNMTGSGCRTWGSSQTGFYWITDTDPTSSNTTLTAGPCGGSGESATAYIYMRLNASTGQCDQDWETPCGGDDTCYGRYAKIKITGDQEAFQYIFPDGLSFQGCYEWGSPPSFKSISITQTNAECDLQLSCSQINRIALSAQVSQCSGKYDGSKFSIQIKFFEARNSELTQFSMLDTTTGSIVVVNNSKTSFDPENFTPDVKEGTAIGWIEKATYDLSDDTTDSQWQINYKNVGDGQQITEGLEYRMYSWPYTILIPTSNTVYRVKLPGFKRDMHGLPGYAASEGWSYVLQAQNSYIQYQGQGHKIIFHCDSPADNSETNKRYLIRRVEYCSVEQNPNQGDDRWYINYTYNSPAKISNIHNGSDPNDPNTLTSATIHYAYNWQGDTVNVSYQVRPTTSSSWQAHRQWQVQFDVQDRAIKYDAGCSTGCSGSGEFENVTYLDPAEFNLKGYEYLIKEKKNALGTVILQNTYQEIDFGQWIPAYWIFLSNMDFELPIVQSNCVDQTQTDSIAGWTLNNPAQTPYCQICPDQYYLGSQSIRPNGHILEKDFDRYLSPLTRYHLTVRVMADFDSQHNSWAAMELFYHSNSTPVSLGVMNVTETGGQLVQNQWKTFEMDISCPQEITELTETTFTLSVSGNYVYVDGLEFAGSIWVAGNSKPVVVEQKIYDENANPAALKIALTRTFDTDNYVVTEKRYTSSTDYRLIKYYYTDKTFSELDKKVEYEKLSGQALTGDSFTTTFGGDDPNRIFTTTYPSGKRANVLIYGDSGNLAQSYVVNLDNDVNSLKETYRYDTYSFYDSLFGVWNSENKVVEHTNARNGITTYTYQRNMLPLLLSQTEPQTSAGSQQISYTYDDARRVKFETHKLDATRTLTTQYNYNSTTGFLDSMAVNGVTTYYYYNPFGQVIREINPDGVKTGKTYGTGGELVSEFTIAANYDPNSGDEDLTLISQTRYTYTADGLIETIGKVKADSTFPYQTEIPDPADPNEWIITKYLYYPDGKQKKVIEDYGNSSVNANLTTEYFYNLQGEPNEVIYPTGKWIKTIRDGRGLVTFEYTGHGTDTVVMETAYDYDADGNLKEQYNPDGTSQFYTYNNFGQLKRVYQQDPNNGPYTEKFYDTASNVNRELSVDSDGTLLRDIRRRYDAVGNLEMERICAEPNVIDDTDDAVTWYKYDVLGNLQYTVQDGPGCSDPNSITDPNNIVTEFIYDGLGRRQHTISPVGVLSSVFYTPGGLPETIIDPNDPAEPNDFITRNISDAAGRLERTVDPEGYYTVNTYNSLNQLTKQTVFDCNQTPDETGNDFAVRQTLTKYDNLGNVIRQVVMKDPNSQDEAVVGLDLITDFVYDYATGLLYQTKTYYGDTPTAAVITYDYDDIGRKISTTDPEGNEDHIVYSQDRPALVEKIQRLENNPGGTDYTITTFFDYDDYGRLWKRILDLDGDGQKDEADTTTEYYYDGLGRLTHEIAPDGIVTFTDYDGFGNVWQKIEDYDLVNSGHFNKTTEYVYNRLNRLDQIKAYDPNDTDPQVGSTQTTTYEYDKAGAVTKITYPDNKCVEYIYNIQNKLDTEIQRNGKWIAYWYDQNRNLIQVSDYDSQDPNWPTTLPSSASFIETFTYDAAGNLKTADKVEGENQISHSQFTYNGFGLKTSETATYFELEPVTTTWDYDGSGNLTSQTHGGTTLSYTHDGLGRIKTIDRGEDRIVNYSYIGKGTKAIEYPEPQVTQSYSYDELGRIHDVNGVDGDDTTILDFVYDYDEVSSRQSEEYHHLTTPVWDKFYYDNLRRLNQVDYAADSPFAFAVEQPELGTNRLSYIASLVLQWLDDGTIIASGDQATSHFVIPNLLAGEESVDSVSSSVIPAQAGFPSLPSVQSAKSVVSNLLTLAEFGGAADTEPNVRTETIYDDNGRLSARIIYDANSNITLFAIYLDDGGKVVITSYYDTTGIRTSNICTTYDAEGNVISREEMPLPTETTETTATMEAVIPNPLASEESVYSATSSFSQADLWLLEADLLYGDGGMMLMSAPSGPSSRTQEFIYDHLGNRYQVMDDYGFVVSTDTYVHNSVNQYQTKTSEDAWSGTTLYTMQHDDNGNLEINENGLIYDYDYRNRLVSISDGTNTIAEYTYDALGRRICKIADGKTIYFYYNNRQQVIAEYENATAPQLTREYVFGNNITEILAMFFPQDDVSENDFQQFLAFCAAWLSETGDGNYDDELDLVNDNKIDFKDFAVFASQWGPFPSNAESHFYYLTDALGSVRGIIGGKFNREEDREFYNYDVYGATSDGFASEINPFMFAGYRYDSESGLYHTVYRPYDFEMGRWLSFDPIADSVNLYEYAKSSPIQYVDPLGLTPLYIEVPLDDWWKQWRSNHPEYNQQQMDDIRKTVGRGCIGITCANLGERHNPDMSNCYDSMGQARRRQKEMEKSCACKPLGAKIYQMHYWSSNPVSKNSNGTLRIPSDWDAGRPGDFINFDFGWYVPGKTSDQQKWICANHADYTDPDFRKRYPNIRPEPMLVKVCDKSMTMYRDFNQKAYCVACEQSDFGPRNTPAKPKNSNAIHYNPW